MMKDTRKTGGNRSRLSAFARSMTPSPAQGRKLANHPAMKELPDD